MRVFIKTVILSLMVLFFSGHGSAQDAGMTMSIGGDVKIPRQWSAEQLKEKSK